MTPNTATTGHLPLASPPSLDEKPSSVFLPRPADIPGWLWPHLLSLDAPLVAVGWQLWWARATRAELHWFHHVILGLAVWMVYLADRLADVLRTPPGAWATERHAFVRQRRGAISALLAANIVFLSALTAWFLPMRQFVSGLGLLIAVGIYFCLTHARKARRWPLAAPKEAVVGALFAVGTSFFALGSAAQMARQAFSFIEVGLFGSLCFLNCALISRWERSPQDLRDRASLLNVYPRLTDCLSVGCIALAASAVICAGLFRRPALEAAPLVFGALGLWALDRCRNVWSKPLLRVLADAVLLCPWALAWFL